MESNYYDIIILIKYMLSKIFLEDIESKGNKKIVNTNVSVSNMYFYTFSRLLFDLAYLHGDPGDNNIILWNIICRRCVLSCDCFFPFVNDWLSAADFPRMYCSFRRRWVQRLHANASISCSLACVEPSSPRHHNSLGWEMYGNIPYDLMSNTYDYLKIWSTI